MARNRIGIGQTALSLTPLEFLDHLAALIPQPPAAPHSLTTPPEPRRASHAAYLWAVLLARIYAVLPLICPVCGTEMRPIAAVTEREPVQRILRRSSSSIKRSVGNLADSHTLS